MGRRRVAFLVSILFSFCGAFQPVVHPALRSTCRSGPVQCTQVSEEPSQLQKPPEPVALRAPDSSKESANTQDNGEVDLNQRTWKSLDMDVVLHSLSTKCKTARGRKKAELPNFREDVEELRAMYECVQEVYRMPEEVPIHSNMDIDSILEIARTGATLEVAEMKDVKRALDTISEMHAYLCRDSGREMAPTLAGLMEPVRLPEALLDIFDGAFDEEDELSGTKFREIGRLRREIRQLSASIRSSVQELLRSGEFAGMLADEGGGAQASEIGGRFVIPVKPTYKRTVGIVHDTSRTGKTLYVEPSAVVGPTNKLSETKLALKMEVQRVLRHMSTLVSEGREDIIQSMEAAAEVDLAISRAKLGTDLQGTVPIIGQDGIIKLKNARHPVLTLQNKDVVGNDVELNGSNQALVLTGPNAGGKTVVLKTLGVMALMARMGLPVPAEEGARIDLFTPILADIGDLQSVSGDLSTFSGHLMVCKAVLESAGKGALVLMDEMGSGTDPAQGVALAQALLEALLNAGSRVALTTHYLQLKELAKRDERFAVAAMQFVDGQPTYRMQLGAVGESFALAVARRVGLAEEVILRAEELLDAGTRQVGDLIQDLENEREELAVQLKEGAKMRSELEKAQKRVEKEQEAAERAKAMAKRDAAAEYALVIEENEKRMKKLFEKARAKSDNVNVIGSSIGEVRSLKRSVESDANAVVDDLGLSPLTAEDRDLLEKGTAVVVCRQGLLYGREASVQKLKRKGVEIDLGGLQQTVSITDLSLVPAGGVKRPKAPPRKGPARPGPGQRVNSGRGKIGISNAPAISSRVQQYLDAEGGGSYREPAWSDLICYNSSANKSRGSDGGCFRSEANTLDLRGQSLAMAKLECTAFFSKAITSGRSHVYVLHGHGTEVLKKGLRQWLSSGGGGGGMVASSRPADQSDGGDAYTLVMLR
ncbi:unnamed protein product [Chrysoparadoxa australica]